MSLPRIDMDAVAALVREAAAAEIMPRWRNLQPYEVRDKGVGDPVTDADTGAERLLSEGLLRLLPGSAVIGEEAVATDPALLNQLHEDRPVWLIDPVDGTINYKNGSEVFCSMVALVRNAETLAGWIYAPVTDEMTMAEKGAGARMNGAPVTASSVSVPERMRAAVHLKYMPEEVRRDIEPRIAAFHGNRQLYCAGLTYVHLASGKLDLAVFWRAKPWDHAMGTLMVEEAGGFSGFADGTRYRSLGDGRTGLLSVSHAANFDLVRKMLFPKGVAGLMDEGRS